MQFDLKNGKFDVKMIYIIEVSRLTGSLTAVWNIVPAKIWNKCSHIVNATHRRIYLPDSHLTQETIWLKSIKTIDNGLKKIDTVCLIASPPSNSF